MIVTLSGLPRVVKKKSPSVGGALLCANSVPKALKKFTACDESFDRSNQFFKVGLGDGFRLTVYLKFGVDIFDMRFRCFL